MYDIPHAPTQISMGIARSSSWICRLSTGRAMNKSSKAEASLTRSVSGLCPPMEMNIYFSQRTSRKLRISGILYLHRIEDDQFSDASLKHLTLLMALCKELNKGFPSAALLVTTMWAQLPLHVRRLRREKEVQEQWNALLQAGIVPRVTRFNNSSESAWETVLDLTTHMDELNKQSSGKLFPIAFDWCMG